MNADAPFDLSRSEAFAEDLCGLTSHLTGTPALDETSRVSLPAGATLWPVGAALLGVVAAAVLPLV